MASEKLVAIVTGGAQGIGYAIVKELLDNGYKVCLVDINEEKGNSVAQELKDKHGQSNVVFRVCNVTQSAHYIDVFEYVLSEFKRIDLLVNNAGILNEKEPKKTMDVKLLDIIYGCEMALRYMGKDNGGNGGMVVNVASAKGLVSADIFPVYSASKLGVVAFTQSYGSDCHYVRSGVIFCALCPHLVNTELLENLRTGFVKPEFEVTKPDIMDPSYVARAVTKLIQDKKNGGILSVRGENQSGYKYVSLNECLDLNTFEDPRFFDAKFLSSL